MPALSKGFSQGLALAVPLAVRKFEIEAAQKKWETEMDMKQDELNLANDELEAEKREAKTKLLIESAQKFQEAGDQKGLESIHEQLRGLGHSGVPEVPAMSPGVLDIAQQLRGEGGVPLAEGIPRKFYTPQTEQEKFEAKEKLKQGHKIELEGVKQEGKEGKALKTWITPDNRIVQLPNNIMPPEGSVPYQTGIEFESTPEGGVSFTTNAMPGKRGQQVTRTTQSKLQQGILDTSAGIQRLDEISQSFKPEFLEIGTRWNAFKTRWKDKLSLDTTKEEQKELDDYSAFRRDAIDNINRYIKEITGAQMSEKEADRLRKAAPDPGGGIFDGDSPIEFKTKWKSAMKSLKLSQARYIYLAKNGMSEDSISKMAKNDTLPTFGQIRAIIRKRDKELEQEIKASNPEITSVDLDRLISQQLKEEFGI